MRCQSFSRLRMHLYLIRHAETNWNKEGRIQGDKDIPLNEKGLQQARLAADKLKDVSFDAIYSSDLLRAMETAQFLQFSNKCEIIPDRRLRERNYGTWKGLTWDEVRSLHYKEYISVKQDSINGRPQMGESMQNLAYRVYEFFNELTSQAFQNVAIVSHNSPLMLLVAKVKGISLTNIRDIEYFYNTEIVILNSPDSQISHQDIWNVQRKNTAPLAFREKIV